MDEEFGKTPVDKPWVEDDPNNVTQRENDRADPWNSQGELFVSHTVRSH